MRRTRGLAGNLFIRSRDNHAGLAPPDSCPNSAAFLAVMRSEFDPLWNFTQGTVGFPTLPDATVGRKGRVSVH